MLFLRLHRSVLVRSLSKGPGSPNVHIFQSLGLKGIAAGRDNRTDECVLGLHKGKGCSAGALWCLTTCLLLHRLDLFIV